MFDWLRTRLGRKSNETHAIPDTQDMPISPACKGTRRGRSQRPIRTVRMQNRRRNKVARASRKRNRV